MTVRESRQMFGALMQVGARALDTRGHTFRVSVFHNLSSGRDVLAVHVGELGGGEALLCRVHSSCVTSEYYGARDCDCAEQLDASLDAIAAEGRGVLFYLAQEGRGAGLVAKARDRMLVQASLHRTTTFEAYEQLGLGHDLRRYDEVAAACALLGIRAPLLLLTNNPDKVEALEREKLRVSDTRSLARAASPFNAHYLGAKRRSGHTLADASGGEAMAELPESVEVLQPSLVAPDLLLAARYLVPIARRDPRDPREVCEPVPGDAPWFRLSLYFDLSCGRELTALEPVVRGAGSAGDAVPIVIQRASLLDRFAESAERRAWRACVRELADAGGGVAVLLPPPPLAAPPPQQDPGLQRAEIVIRRHVDGRAVRTIDAKSAAAR